MKLSVLVMILAVGAFSSLLLANSPDATEALTLITPTQAAQLASDKGAIILDVRESDEWQSGHIRNAKHIPLDQLKARLGELGKYKGGPIITQCQSGGRSAKAAHMLKMSGFPHVYDMDGGIVAWDKADFPIE